MNFDAKWIWLNSDYSSTPQLVLFRKEIELNTLPEELLVDVSADSRYNLYVNNRIVSRGPCRGDNYRKYYDTVDLVPFLKTGINTVAAEVIHYPNDLYNSNNFNNGPISVVSSSRGGFLIREHNETLGFSTDSSYKCILAKFYNFKKAKFAGFLSFFEDIDARLYPEGWKDANFCDSNWSNCFEIYDSREYISQFGHSNIWTLERSPIPTPYEKTSNLKKITRYNGLSLSEWEVLINCGRICIPQNTEIWVEIDMGESVTAFPSITIENGLDSTLEILYSECYEVIVDENLTQKKIRDDYSTENAILKGEQDIYTCSSGRQSYMPVLYRSFRYIRLNIKTKKEPIYLENLFCIKTGYPLNISGSFISDDTKNKMWKISERTLLNCMYETYMDCPFYEQMQYLMDTLLEMLFTYQISSDDRLARKAIYDFHSAQLPNGIIPCNAPSKVIQLIPGFSFYWVTMMTQHYNYFGDTDFIRPFLGTIDRLFVYFKNHMDENSNLLKQTGYWEFVDWVKEWDQGIPVKNADEVNIINNLMFITALNEASRLNIVCGRTDTGLEYMSLAEKIKNAVKIYGFDNSDGLYFDVPQRKEKSQHAQVWAVLSGVCEGEEAKKIMLECITRQDLCKCSYCMSFFLFRALEKANMYEKTEKLWDIWERLLDFNITTWPEDPVNQRSDCHAWGSLPLYEFAASFLGVTPAEPGYSVVKIEPKALWLSKCSGKVATCIGDIEVEVTNQNNIFSIAVNAPEGANLHIYLPDGTVKKHKYREKIYESCIIKNCSSSNY